MVSLIAVNINGERPNFFFQGWSSLANHSSLNKGPQTPRSQGQEYGKHILIPIVVFLMFTGKKTTNIQRTYAHMKHIVEQTCCFQIQPTSLLTITLSLTSI